MFGEFHFLKDFPVACRNFVGKCRNLCRRWRDSFYFSLFIAPITSSSSGSGGKIGYFYTLWEIKSPTHTTLFIFFDGPVLNYPPVSASLSKKKIEVGKGTIK